MLKGMPSMDATTDNTTEAKHHEQYRTAVTRVRANDSFVSYQIPVTIYHV